MSRSLASDADMLVAFATARNSVTGSANVDVGELRQDGRRGPQHLRGYHGLWQDGRRQGEIQVIYYYCREDALPPKAHYARRIPCPRSSISFSVFHIAHTSISPHHSSFPLTVLCPH
jgi:hypothetical protein